MNDGFKGLRSGPYLGIIVVRAVALLLERDEIIRDKFEIVEDRDQSWISWRFLVRDFGGCTFHLAMIEHSGKSNLLVDVFPIASSFARKEMEESIIGSGNRSPHVGLTWRVW